MSEISNFNPADKSARPYCVSVDWLSVSCRDQGFLHFDTELQPSGYRLVKLSHGSKVFSLLYDVYDPDGQHVAELQAKPYNKAMDESSVILKATNCLLYQRDGIEQFFACITSLALYYKGINRIDLCCDQNEFYNGLLPTSLIKNYSTLKYLKLGINHGYKHFDLRYHGIADKAEGLKAWSKMPLVSQEARQKRAEAIKERNEELAKVGLPLLDTSEAHVLSEVQACDCDDSITWGARGTAVQVQLYNKTKELQEVKLKHYIVDTWKAAGLEIGRDIYRVEIRIHGKGKGLINPATGKEFELHLIDTLSQQGIEELFFAYADKHFKFFQNEGLVKIRKCTPVKLWHRLPPTIKPKQLKPKKNPTRFILIVANKLMREAGEIRQQAKREQEANIIDKDGKPIYSRTERLAQKIDSVSDYFAEQYRIGEWMEFHKQEEALSSSRFYTPAPAEVHTSKAWTLSAVAQELLQKISERAQAIRQHRNAVWDMMTKAQRDKWSNMVVDHDKVFEETQRYETAVDRSLRTLTYIEYLPPTQQDEDETFDPIQVDWDNINFWDNAE